jgi:hypothetical protein
VSRHPGSGAPVRRRRQSIERDGDPAAPDTASGFALGRGWRIGILVVVCAIAAATIGRTVLTVRDRSASPTRASSAQPVPGAGINGGSYLLIRSTSLDRDYGRVGIVKQSDPVGPRPTSRVAWDFA